MGFINWKNKFFKNEDIEEEKLRDAYSSLSSQGIAVYAISADPPTWGHADIMMRSAKKFGKIFWVIAQNEKKKSLFSDDVKLQMMKSYIDHYKLENVELDVISGSTAKYAKTKKAQFLIRGLRSSSDYQMEFELSVGNRGISKGIETICLFTKPHYATISSSIVRELAMLDEKISQYVHSEVEAIIKSIINKDQ